MPDRIGQAIEYHEATKHHFDRYARGPGYLDWATQPDPFRRYEGAPVISLKKIPPDDRQDYDTAFTAGRISPAALSFSALSRLFYDSLALSAWKSSGGATWALRVNPSSGNLHPTEGYLICGPLPGLGTSPAVYHYAPRDHALELRATLPHALWEKLTESWPHGTLFVGLTSIHWREAWKYGERAFRYCQLDVGHALGAVTLAASGLGWRAALLDGLSHDQLECLLGTSGSQASQAEREEPDCLVAIGPHGPAFPTLRSLDPEAIEGCSALAWQGRPNRLSRSHMNWDAIDAVSRASRKPLTDVPCSTPASTEDEGHEVPQRGLSLRRILHQRRSAVSMDGTSTMSRSDFYRLLMKTLPGPDRLAFAALPWDAQVHLVLFVHRIQGLHPGLYLLVRNAAHKVALQAGMKDNFLWRKPEGCPRNLHLFCLAEGDVRKMAMQLSCFQDIAGDGCFSAGMIVRFQENLESKGAWFYPRLYWECGMIGQVLYLEAEALNLRGTGIGCFFDNPNHEILGLQDLQFQDLYHFTVGGPVEDPRISTLPPYPEDTP